MPWRPALPTPTRRPVKRPGAFSMPAPPRRSSSPGWSSTPTSRPGINGCRTEDIGKALDGEGLAVRSGHHCAQPILRRFSVESTVTPPVGAGSVNPCLSS
ncbi:aminotransferase class V-fold PLP-dependent enzyme [Paramagnetospirillum magneticum]|uniref:aminotransferase class V-fold PLP-dependent enzyme n=1 Tax=Paramagnetospirillum magneticum TaxID=84159 RepID=UPI000324EBA2